MLNDLWVLRLDSLEYAKVNITSELGLKPRYGHSSAMFGTKLCIFGGINDKMTFCFDAQEIEFDLNLVQQKINRAKSELLKRKKAEEAERERMEILEGIRESNDATLQSLFKDKAQFQALKKKSTLMNIMEKQNTTKRSDTKNPPSIRIESRENSGRNVVEELATPLHTSLGTDLEELGGKLENSID